MAKLLNKKLGVLSADELGRDSTSRGVYIGSKPSLSLDFTEASPDLTGVTFTRASAATYFGRDGLLKTQGYNLAPDSENTSSAGWTVSAGAEKVSTSNVDAFGRNTAMLLRLVSVEGINHTSNPPYAAFTAGTTYTASIYIRPVTDNKVQLTFTTASHGAGQYANFSLVGDGSISASAGCVAAISPVAKGYYRCSISAVATGTGNGSIAVAFLASLSDTRLPPFTGVGNETISIGGYQVEASTVPNGYTATTTAANGGPRLDYDPATPADTTGVELVTNGDFSQGTSGWVAVSGAQVSIDNGALKVVSVGATYGSATQLITGLTSGKTYLIRCLTRRGNAGVPAWLITSTGGVVKNNPTPTLTADSTMAVYVVCNSTQISLTFQCQNVDGSTMWVDDVSTQEVTFAPRGLLIEEQRTNLLLWSRDTTNAVWAKTDVTAAPATGIDGVAGSADLITEGSAGTAIISQSASVAAGSTITASVVVKRGNTDWFRLQASESSVIDGGQAWFNLATGIKGVAGNFGAATAVSSTITPLGGGWYRCTVTVTPNGTYTTAVARWRSAAADASGTLVANATYTVDCAQLEVGASATSIVPTTTATVTRAADIPVLEVAGKPWFTNNGKGTFIIELDTVGSNSYAQWLDSVPSNTIAARHGGIKNQLESVVFGTGFSGAVPGVTPAGGRVKAAISFDAGSIAVVIKGILSASGTPPNGTSTPPTSVHIGKASWGPNAAQINDHVRGLTYYPARPPNVVLQSLTLL